MEKNNQGDKTCKFTKKRMERKKNYTLSQKLLLLNILCSGFCLQWITSVGLLELSNFIRLSVTPSHTRLYQTHMWYSLLANLTLAATSNCCPLFQPQLWKGRGESMPEAELFSAQRRETHTGEWTCLHLPRVYIKVLTHATGSAL